MNEDRPLTLPPDFQFNQGNLQDFIECRRRFQLRHIQRLAWPALPAEPALENERHLLQGAAFHRLVQQYLSGLPLEKLSPLAQESGIRRWWQNFQESAPQLAEYGLEPGNKEYRLYPELTLTGSAAGFRLLAKYDLILVTPQGGAVIFDWKTNRKRPGRAALQERMQTRLYPFLLVQAGASLHGGQPLQPEQVQMVYWFAEYPQEPEHFRYRAAQYEQDQSYLEGLLAAVLALQPDQFSLTDNLQRCRFCVYRSLCDRGVRAGDIFSADETPEADEELEIDLDFSSLPEIEY